MQFTLVILLLRSTQQQFLFYIPIVIAMIMMNNLIAKLTAIFSNLNGSIKGPVRFHLD